MLSVLWIYGEIISGLAHLLISYILYLCWSAHFLMIVCDCRCISGRPAPRCPPARRASSRCPASRCARRTITTCPPPTPASPASTSLSTPARPCSRPSCCSLYAPSHSALSEVATTFWRSRWPLRTNLVKDDKWEVELEAQSWDGHTICGLKWKKIWHRI